MKSIINEDKFELSRSLPRQSADKIMSLLMEYNMLTEAQGYIKFSYKLKFLLIHSIWNFRFYDNSLYSIFDLLYSSYSKNLLEFFKKNKYESFKDEKQNNNVN